MEDFGAALAVEDDEVVAGCVDEGAVVGDEDEGAGVTGGVGVVVGEAEGLFEAFGGGDVEVVGGFVEDEEVLGAGEEAGEACAGAFAAGEGADGLVLVFAGEEERAGEFAGLLLGEGAVAALAPDDVLKVLVDLEGLVRFVAGLGSRGSAC